MRVGMVTKGYPTRPEREQNNRKDTTPKSPKDTRKLWSSECQMALLTIMPLDIRWIRSSAFLVAKNTRRYTKPLTILWRVTAAEVMRCERIISRKSWAFLRRKTCRPAE